MAGPVARRSLGQLWKQGWNEIPEVMGSSLFAILGIGMGVYQMHRYYKDEVYNHRFKDSYLVYRPEDPHAARIRVFEDSPPVTRVTSSSCK